MRVYSTYDLARADGREGRQALVAVDGKVYDVSASEKWPGGMHMRRHEAGTDLSADIAGAPHDRSVLDRFPVVGTYEEAAKPERSGLRASVDQWLDRHPFFRRHPHPAMVHVPIGLFLVAPAFLVIGMVFQSDRTEWASLCCAMTGLLAIPPAIASGYGTWWINYELVDSPIIRKKRRLAWATLVAGAVAIAFRLLLVRDPIAPSDPLAVLNLIFVVVLAIMIGFLGYLGGRLTFPFE